MHSNLTRLLFALALGLLAAPVALGQCPAAVPVEGAPPPGPLPLFPPDNWWNTDISAAPVDTNSAGYIAFINNGGTRHLHPDFGGEVSPGSVDIYGMPYAIVDGAQPKLAVTFNRESRSTRFPRRRSRSRTGSKAARPATSTTAARTATC
jgi:hypothetical protein